MAKKLAPIGFARWAMPTLPLYGIEINSTIPTGVEVDTSDPKWKAFETIRLPQIERETVKKRAKYLEIQRSIEARMSDSLDLGVDGS